MKIRIVKQGGVYFINCGGEQIAGPFRTKISAEKQYEKEKVKERLIEEMAQGLGSKESIIKSICKTKMPTGDRSELESFLLEKLVTNIMPLVDTDKPENIQRSYIIKSLNGWANNFFRDLSRPVRIPRGMHDLYNKIRSTQKRMPHLKDKERLPELLTEIDKSEQEYKQALEAWNTRYITFEPYMANQLEDDSSTEAAMMNCLSETDRIAVERFIAGKTEYTELIGELSSMGFDTVKLIFG